MLLNVTSYSPTPFVFHVTFPGLDLKDGLLVFTRCELYQ